MQFVPGLLQTEEYARAVMMLGHGDARARARSTGGSTCGWSRQQVLSRADPPQLWVVVDEAVLRRPIGGPDGDARAGRSADRADQAAQRAASRCCRSPPAGTPPPGGAFSLLRFPDQDLPDVVYVEQLTSALYLDKRDDVEQYVAAMERLCIEAEPPARTTEILERILRDL